MKLVLCFEHASAKILTCIILLGCQCSYAQIDSMRVPPRDVEVDSISILNELQGLTMDVAASPVISSNSKRRVSIVSVGHGFVFAGGLLVLNQAWYQDYPRSKFHFFNDNAEWLQIDKIGHVWSAYHQSRLSFETWRWAGLSPKKQILLGGFSGVAFQGVIETLDGFSSQWGWSWGDFASNVAGSGLFISQELMWHEQRISFKWGFYSKTPKDDILKQRSIDLYGSRLPERMLKDYNGQTYWLSFNIKSFIKGSGIPPWLNLAIGYGADGMWGARDNKWIDVNTLRVIDRTDIVRVRQFYFSPDIDFTRIPTNRKWLKKVFFVLNAFKMPTPSIEFSQGNWKLKLLTF